MTTSPPKDTRKEVGPNHNAPLQSQDAREELLTGERRDTLPEPTPQVPNTVPQVVALLGPMMGPANPTGQFQQYLMPQPPPYYYPYPYPQCPQGMYPHSQYQYTHLPGTDPKQMHQGVIAQNPAPVPVICRSQSIPVPPIPRQGDSRRNSANLSRQCSHGQTPS